MKIFVDARWTRTDAHDGISRFGANLIAELHRLHPVTMIIHDDRQLTLLPADVPHVKLNNPISARELDVPCKLNRLGADVVFSPMQVMGSVGRRYRLIFTLHDLIYYRHPTPPTFLPAAVRLAWRLYHRAYWPQRLLLNRADSVVTVSEASKRLIEEHRLTKRPVTVVYNAPEEGFGSDRATEAATGDSADDGVKNLVYMGSFMPYKNVETLIAGMASLPGYRLHLLSRIAPAREAELTALIPAGADVKFWRGVSDERYRQLLTGATALVTGSRDEGFGLPLIEAMKADTPVVCSDLAVFREVAEDAARYFDPDSVAGFVAAVRAASDPAVREEMLTAGRKRATTFTWRASAQRLMDLIRTL